MSYTSTNASSSFPFGFPSMEQRIVDDATLEILLLVLKYILVPSLGLFGICSNTINIVVYSRMGISDGVNQSFIILSISDMLVSVASLLSSICLILYDKVFINGSKSHFDASTIAWSCTVVVRYFQYGSMVTTAVISVVRCICVIIPLKAKQIVTPKRQLIAIVGFYILCAVVFAITYSSAYMDTFRLGPEEVQFIMRGDRLDASYTFTSVMFNSGVVVIIICVAVLSISLRRSSQLRKDTTNAKTKDVDKEDASTRANKRDLQVVKVVIVVASIFIACYVPQIAVTVCQLLFEADDGQPLFGHYMNFIQFLVMANEVSVSFNAGINLVFYVSYNSRFKEAFKKL